VIIRGLIDDWRALHCWSDLEYLKQRVVQGSQGKMSFSYSSLSSSCLISYIEGDDLITVDVTPNGKGDCVMKNDDGGLVFTKPEERRMRFSDFIDSLSESGHINDGVVKVSSSLFEASKP